MSPKRKGPSAVERLMAAMARCAVARGEAQWTNGYRAAKGKPSESNLYRKEMLQWERVGRADAAFRRVAQNVLRTERQKARAASRRVVRKS